MKKLICIVTLSLVSSLAFADETGVQKVLDAVHKKGFMGCDDEIRRAYQYDEVNYVDVRSPFAIFEKNASGANTKKVVGDEIVVVVDITVNRDYEPDVIGGAEATIFRKIGKQCHVANSFGVTNFVGRDCKQVAQYLTQTAVFAEAGDSYWMGYEGRGASVLLTPMPNGGCRHVGLPSDMSDKPAK